ncbi:ATP-dependent DNA ligase [Actinocatenispora thailandica]|uniref:DNA ligase (ATP) n=1 Tax=Actinocatenispora thailandica TaxID=227318 RepID=A0A7R7HVY5_9ACTN|nr:non-homologous end-joining DNA ligase [Actinocatenispora thailandica]BCJ34146.1 ATP-dependent DNA ligase [Actinocatenispora thailandica]
MAGLLDALPDSSRNELRPARRPRVPQAMLATLTDRYFSDPDWLFERKLDGERVLAVREHGRVRLTSRNDRPVTGYPELAEALSGGTPDLIVDGEVVAFEGNQTSFARLQQRMQIADPDRSRATGVAIRYYLFDVLYADGYDLTRVPLRQRKAVLRRAIRFADPLRYTAHRNARGEQYLAHACRAGWEGLIAKRANAPYHPGRSRDWLKFKCVDEQEFVIGGFTDPAGSRTGFGALLVGYYERGKLRYAGKVGTGYDRATLRRLRDRLGALETDSAPFATPPRGRGVHWVRPELVAQAGFTEWTSDGLLRHPRFLGLRRDKSPAQVVRERPQ